MEISNLARQKFTLRQLGYFLTAVELGSIRAASDEWRVSEAGIAHGIAELEKSLQQTLLIRQKSKGVTATAEGLVLLPRAKSILDQSADLVSTADDLGSELVGSLRIGCYSSFSPFICPSIYADFAAPHPNLDVTIEEGTPDDIQDSLLRGRLDCVLIQRRQALPEVQTRSLRIGMPRLILAANHPLAQSETVSLHDLQHEPMVLLDLPAVRDNLLPMIRDVGITPDVQFKSQVFETVRSLVARGLGWSILIHQPPTGVSYEGLPVATRTIAEPIARSDISIGILAGRFPNARLRAFEEHCRAFLNSIDY